MAEMQSNSRARQRALASRVLFGLCVAWITTMVSIQFYQASVHGYGSGFGDGKRMPPELVERVGAGNDVAAVVKATMVPISGDIVEDVVRLVFSIAVLAGLYFFWYWLLSRLGSF